MSVYIPGIDMPKSCNECRFFVDAWCYALEVDDWRNAYNKPQEGKRLDGCPLIPVPDHGRLGDLDDVINDVRHYLCEGCSDYFGPDAKTESCDYCRGTMLIKAIERKSSIIPAEGEDYEVPAEEGET